MHLLSHILLSQLLLTILCALINAKETSNFSVKPHLVHEFPLETYLQSMAVRKRDGNIIVSSATTAQVFLVSTDNQFEPVELATLPGVNAAVGIVETCTDEFYIGGGNLSVTGHTTEANSFSVWKLDLKKGQKEAELTKVTDLPQALLLDRIMQWDEETLFISDSILGVVWSLNIRSGTAVIVLNDTETMSPITQSGVGINYLAFHEGFIYYANSERGEISRIPVDPHAGLASGPAEVLIKNKGELYPQGFAFRGDNLWLANSFNQIMLMSDVGAESASQLSLEVVAGSLTGTKFAGLSDCKFGTTPQDIARGSLYVSSIGKVGDDWTFGGSIWRLDVGGFP